MEHQNKFKVLACRASFFCFQSKEKGMACPSIWDGGLPERGLETQERRLKNAADFKW